MTLKPKMTSDLFAPDLAEHHARWHRALLDDPAHPHNPDSQPCDTTPVPVDSPAARRVHPHTDALGCPVQLHSPEVGLCRSKALIRSLAEPDRSLRIILRHTFTAAIHPA